MKEKVQGMGKLIGNRMIKNGTKSHLFNKSSDDNLSYSGLIFFTRSSLIGVLILEECGGGVSFFANALL